MGCHLLGTCRDSPDDTVAFPVLPKYNLRGFSLIEGASWPARKSLAQNPKNTAVSGPSSSTSTNQKRASTILQSVSSRPRPIRWSHPGNPTTTTRILIRNSSGLGKKEHASFEVPTVSLHVHERIDPATIIEAVRKRNGAPLKPAQGYLFETKEENPPLREAVDFYRHSHGWTNRLIAGDSLLVMNSLLEKEGMARQIQMVYIDPPYGIRYGSNFQPFVNRRDVKDGKDEDLTQEPEMIRAFRDTWELGVHSYLTYLRDRLRLAKELLHDSGSCFVQISDENVHHVRELMDEVFGGENFVSNLNFQTMTPLESGRIENVFDYILWYCVDKEKLKYRNLLIEKALTADGEFRFIQSTVEGHRDILPAERLSLNDTPQLGRVFKRSALESSGFTKSCTFPFDFEGQTFNPRGGKSWRTNPKGMAVLKAKNRLFILGSKLYYKLFYLDFPYTSMVNSWPDTIAGYSEPKRYVVQTHPKIIQRCLLMCSDPGDLILDPTCGSGTTAVVAEQWGRRWVTCDTSRVATTLTKQRLMGATFDYYTLAHPPRVSTVASNTRGCRT
jgi:adenine-specific DNA-methyltransferase